MAAIAGDGLDLKGTEVRLNSDTFSLADLDLQEGRGLAELGVSDDAR